MTGLAMGVLIFVVSSGLTLVLGVLRVANFAHGGFFLVGAYASYQIQQHHAQSLPVFIALVIVAGLITAVIGIATERLLFRQLYDLPEATMLLGTYALLLILQGAVQQIWGFNQKSQPEPKVLGSSVHLGSVEVPRYDLLLFVVGVVVFLALWYTTKHTAVGRQISAVAEDRYMSSLLGIRVTGVYAATFTIGVFLAGLGGALAGPTLSMTPDIALTYILDAFAVVIVGGFGSITGSLVASLVIGLLGSYLAVYVPSLADFALYMPMIVILVLRPRGLFGAASGVRAAV